MKSLKDYICESMFDEEDVEKDVIGVHIKDWIIDHYHHIKTHNLKISSKTNKDGKYVVDYKYNVQTRDASMVSLTNDMFVWGEVKGSFDCSCCYHLTSLEGAPKEVGGDFFCNFCNGLTSLEGAPEKVYGGFYCVGCKSLKSLNGIPKKVGREIICSRCAKDFTKEDIKKAQKS